jgi:UDP-N-acetylglucosamine 2-epimerase
MMKLLSIVGARPQFIKVAMIAAGLDAHARAPMIEHRVLHTGQHYDSTMSDCFFRELSIPDPHFHLGIGSGPHGVQTGKMLGGIESVLDGWRPDAVIVYGDTNSTLAGALAAAKLHIRVIHLEAGLRSFNRRMPEELNRIGTDHLSDLLLCPTATAMANAKREGLAERSQLTGDVMLDLLQQNASRLARHPLAHEDFALVTVHRAENTEAPEHMSQFIAWLGCLPLRAVLPMHPRLRSRLSEEQMSSIERMEHVHVLPPCGYAEMVSLERDATLILTDSGGVQKEAYFLGVPCLTLREETEWTETLTGGWNRLVGMEPDGILKIVQSVVGGNGYMPSGKPDLAQFGSGQGTSTSVNAIIAALENAS